MKVSPNPILLGERENIKYLCDVNKNPFCKMSRSRSFRSIGERKENFHLYCDTK